MMVVIAIPFVCKASISVLYHCISLTIIITTSCVTFLNHNQQWTLSLYQQGYGHHPKCWVIYVHHGHSKSMKPIQWLMYDWSTVPRYATWQSTTPATTNRWLPVLLGPLSHQGPLILYLLQLAPCVFGTSSLVLLINKISLWCWQL